MRDIGQEREGVKERLICNEEKKVIVFLPFLFHYGSTGLRHQAWSSISIPAGMKKTIIDLFFFPGP